MNTGVALLIPLAAAKGTMALQALHQRQAAAASALAAACLGQDSDACSAPPRTSSSTSKTVWAAGDGCHLQAKMARRQQTPSSIVRAVIKHLAVRWCHDCLTRS